MIKIFIKAFSTLDINLLEKLKDDKFYSWKSKSELIFEIDDFFQNLKKKNISSLTYTISKCNLCYPNAPVYTFYHKETGCFIGTYVITETEDQYIFEECKNNPVSNRDNGIPF